MKFRFITIISLILLVLSILSFFNIFENLRFYFIALFLISVLMLIYDLTGNFVKFLAFAVPILLLTYILYMNFLPLGFSDNRVIEVGSAKDDSGIFYLEQSSSLGARQVIDGTYFRPVDGIVNAVYKPSVILKNVTVSAELKGEGVYFVKQPELNFKLDYFDLDKFEVLAPHTTYKQFLQGKEINLSEINNEQFAVNINYNSAKQNNLLTGDISLKQDSKQIIVNYINNNIERKITYNLPDFFIGKQHEILLGFNKENIYLFVDSEFVGKSIANKVNIKQIKLNEGQVKVFGNYENQVKETIAKDNDCLVFDGKTRLILPNSFDNFETGPFVVYVEWKPLVANNSQQLIGHFNWEVWQNKDKIQFRVGRMYNQGPSYSVFYPVKEDFFNRVHNLLAVYNPSQKANESGYIELYVDENFAERKEFGNETIWKDYNGAQDLGLGWSPHNYEDNPYFNGNICSAKFAYTKLVSKQSDKLEFNVEQVIGEDVKIPIIGQGNLKEVKIKIIKN